MNWEARRLQIEADNVSRGIPSLVRNIQHIRNNPQPAQPLLLRTYHAMLKKHLDRQAELHALGYRAV